ncbi:MAG: hypothetical protein Q8Q20_05915 [bacterium]|nr:hypothetical protein [bacterium]
MDTVVTNDAVIEAEEGRTLSDTSVIRLPVLPVRTDPINSVESAMRVLSFLKWKEPPAEEGKGRTAFAVLGGNRETGEVWVMAAIEGGAAPDHEHLPGGRYGELIITLAGTLEDTTDSGQEVQVGAGQILVHGDMTTHAPRASKFWLGIYHQPRGSRVIKG